MRRLAGSRDGLDRRGRLWGAPTGQGAGAFLKMGALPAQSRGLLAPYDHQTRSRSNASRCIRCGHGGGSLGGCMGEYRRARGSLHVRGPLWLRSQVPIRRPKGHSFTQDEDIYTGSTGTVRYLQSIGTILPTRTSTVQYLQYRTIYEYGERPYRPWYRQWTAHSDRALDQGAADQSVQWLLATSTYTALQRCSTVAGTVQL
jgi:hypothetical protein